ncbi:peptidase inhibitor family I36 protein [Streptacidiphilus sp. EB129]|uniref:peptidase inhibitor family I36 protein n=1 Tax=Streptacidiphilus sp. EB129 TaxID=3156262 RepID=UPI00351331CE
MTLTSGAAQLFVDENYAGASMILAEGAYNIERLDAPDAVGNDTVSSLTVVPGYQVTVYTDADFGGDSTTFTTDTPYVGDDLNDKISSVVVVKTTTASSSGFTGAADLGGSSRALFQLEAGFTNTTGALQGDTGSTALF